MTSPTKVWIENLAPEVLLGGLVTLAYVLCLDVEGVEAGGLATSICLVIVALRASGLALVWAFLLPGLFDSLERARRAGEAKIATSLAERLDALPRRLAFGLNIAWTLTYPLCALLLGLGLGMSFDSPRVLITLAFALACSFSVVANTQNQVAQSLNGLRLAVAGLIAERDWSVHRRPDSLRQRALIFAVGVFGTTLCWLGAVSIRVADSLREAELEHEVAAIAQLLSERLIAEGASEAEALLGSAERLGGSAWLFDREGELRVAAGEVGAEAARAFASREVLAREPQRSRALERCLVAVRMPEGEVLVVVGPQRQIVAPEAWLWLGLFVILTLSFTFICSLNFVNRILPPLERLQAACVSLFETGRIREAAMLPVASGDELGRVTAAFNALLSRLKSLVNVANAVAAGQLTIQVQGRGDLVDAFATMVVNLRGVVGEITQESAALASLGTELLTSSQAQVAAADDQGRQLLRIGDATSELERGMSRVSEQMQDILRSAEHSESTAASSLLAAQALRERTQRIRELLKTIQKISRQSRMLALNIEIEATRGQSAERSFSAIAVEARRLTEGIDASVDSVRELLDEIEAAGSQSLEAAEDNRSFVATTADLAREVSRFASQQVKVTRSTTRKLRIVGEAIEGSLETMQASRGQAEALYGQAHRLSRAVSRLQSHGAGQATQLSAQDSDALLRTTDALGEADLLKSSGEFPAAGQD